MIYLIILVVFGSCHPREFAIIRNFDHADRKELLLDTTYHFFVREIYKVDSANVHFSLTDKKTADRFARRTLIEIEYILYSKEHRKIVYITTVPDRYQTYYATHSMPEGIMNARDFNTFHLGKLQDKTINAAEDKIDFKSIKGNTRFTWQYNIVDDTFHIRRIIETKGGVYQDERSVENSIYKGAKFRKVNGFQFVFKDNKKDTTLIHMSDPVLYFDRKNKKYCALLSFDERIPKRFMPRLFQRPKKSGSANKEFSAIIYKGPHQVPYDPNPVVE